MKKVLLLLSLAHVYHVSILSMSPKYSKLQDCQSGVLSLLENDAEVLCCYRKIERDGHYCFALRDAEIILKGWLNSSACDYQRIINPLVTTKSIEIAQSVVRTAQLRKEMQERKFYSREDIEKISNDSDLATVHGFGSNGGTIVHYALDRLPHDFLLKIVPDMHVNINGVDKNGKTPLFYAFELMGKQREHAVVFNALKLLIDYGADVHCVDKAGNTLLHCSMRPHIFGYIMHEQYRLIEMLVNAGADINKQNKVGYTPLHALLTEKSIQIDLLSYLLQQYTLDFTVRTYDGETFLQIQNKQNLVRKRLEAAFTYQILKAIQYDCYEKFIQLLDAGADVNGADEDGNTLLHYAVMHSLDYVNALIKRKAQVNVQNKEGFTPLLYVAAVFKADCPLKFIPAVCRCLLMAGADVHSIHPLLQFSPLHYAIRNGARELEKLFLDYSAIVDHKAYTLSKTSKERFIAVACFVDKWYENAECDSSI